MRHTHAIEKKIVVGIIYQIMWFVLVISAGRPASMLAIPSTLMLVGLLLLLYSNNLKLDLVFIASAALLGFASDSILIGIGILEPVRSIMPAPFAPLWLASIWIIFVLFLRISLKSLQKRPLLQFIIGAVGGPLAYWSGTRLGALALHDHLPLTFIIMAGVWALICRSLFLLSARLSGETNG
jgi:hypothetical protein